MKRVASTYASGKSYQIYRGDPSGIGVTVPVPTPAELSELYASTYDYGAHALIENEKRWRNRKLVDHLMAGGASIGTVLDVGCMYGYLLEEPERGARAVHGIEIAAGPAGAAAAKGFAIHQGTIEAYAASTPAGTFDAIFAQHVLEHVGDPLLFLRAALALLKLGGKLALVVPHVDRRRGGSFDLLGWYQVPAHLFHFSRRALTSLCASAGFAVDGQRTRGGDSLFMLMTLAHAVGGLLRPGAETQPPQPLSPARQLLVRGASLFLRPYLYPAMKSQADRRKPR